MPTSTPWCNASASCPLEWRPSAWLVGALALLAVLAPLSVLASELPRPWAWLLAADAGGYGLWLAWREARRPRQQLQWPMADARVAWRGPLLFVRAPGAALSWWPDTLDAGQRRDLRLASQ